jgi:4-carboxymuconolactone decarboxylase
LVPGLSVGGWGDIRAVLEGDGALTAREKALILVTVAATKGRPRLLSAEVERLRGLGGEDDLAALPAVLRLSRGPEVASSLADAIAIRSAREEATSEAAGEDEAEREALPADAEPEQPGADEADEARRFFAPPGSPEPAAIRLLGDHAPQALVGYRGLREAVYEDGPLDARLVELALFAVMSADYVAAHAGVHAARATAAGASEAELVEAGLCAVAAGGMGAWLIAAAAIDGR